jgi:hypothetical protein
MTEPTERSIPPDKITNVIPTATTIKNALSINKFKNTCVEKKPVYLKDPKIYMVMNNTMVAVRGRCLESIDILLMIASLPHFSSMVFSF